MARLFVYYLVVFSHCALADGAIPLPFEGHYESRDSVAREKVIDSQWREIPQDVLMLVAKDDDIIELQLLIEVYSLDGSNRTFQYTISNKMWLAKKRVQPGNVNSDRVDFDVYKRNRFSNRFDDLGDGYCENFECRYSYVTEKSGEQQRYQSHITWQPQTAGTEFKQTGALSIRKDGELEWVTYKTWENTFKISRQGP